jgi:hypothetical protein
MVSIKNIVKKTVDTIKNANEQAKMDNTGKSDVVSIALTVFIVAAIIPAALIALNDANTTGFTSGQLALYGIIGLVALIAVVMGIMKFVKK